MRVLPRLLGDAATFVAMGAWSADRPNIDRVAHEGMIFKDYCGEQICTAGPSTFITGQSGFRAGLLKVGVPGADTGPLTGKRMETIDHGTTAAAESRQLHCPEPHGRLQEAVRLVICS